MRLNENTATNKFLFSTHFWIRKIFTLENPFLDWYCPYIVHIALVLLYTSNSYSIEIYIDYIDEASVVEPGTDNCFLSLLTSVCYWKFVLWDWRRFKLWSLSVIGKRNRVLVDSIKEFKAFVEYILGNIVLFCDPDRVIDQWNIERPHSESHWGDTFFLKVRHQKTCSP